LTKSISTVVSIHDLGWLVFWLLLFFSIKLVELVPLAQLWTHRGAQLIFPLKPNFCNLFELAATKSIQKSIYLPHLIALKIVK
jgi:hypothetical protein